MSEWRARVTRVDEPSAGLLCLSLRGREQKGVLVVSRSPGGLGVGWVLERPKGKSADTAVTQLRHHLVGASVVGVEEDNQMIRVAMARGDQEPVLVCSAVKPLGAWWLVDRAGRVLLRASGAPPLPQAYVHPAVTGSALTLATLQSQGMQVLEKHRKTLKKQAQKRLAQAIRRAEKKKRAIVGDLDRMGQADAMRKEAEHLLATLHERDPKTQPAKRAEKLFGKARRLSRGGPMAAERLTEVDRELARLTELGALAAQEQVSVEILHAELRALGVTLEGQTEVGRSKRRRARRPYRKFLSADGEAILVGRSAKDNDTLTLRVAKPHDLWLHTRDVTGAHVVVPLVKGRTCPPERLVDAATLAAHFSDVRGERQVDVLYTSRRYIRKRKGGAAGEVRLDREKVMCLRVEPARLARLLQSEQKEGL